MAGALVAERVRGSYVMYFLGEEEPWRSYVGVAYSEDLLEWRIDMRGPIIKPRAGRWDSSWVEPGPPPYNSLWYTPNLQRMG
ncbi:MAG: hypothetical protein B6U69_03015 [Thermofilum sp. ex4484_15]|nr:MAG: hypothetical protein B6U69_03015 [Thermofilum sp. ex4484_15]